MLRAQPAHQLAEDDAQLARKASGVDSRTHDRRLYLGKSRKTAQFPCIIYMDGERRDHPSEHRRKRRRAGGSNPGSSDRYKWIALSNTTLAVLLATLDGSITLIAMPDIFRGIHLDPLVPANSFYLLWMILGFLVVTSVLIVSLGRLGDMYGRVRIYNLGFVIYTVASLLLTVDWMTRPRRARPT